MKFYSKIILLCLIPIVLMAQRTGKIKGVIVDANSNTPLPGVNILLKGTYHGAASDVEGKYVISGISPGTYTMQISLIGYKTVEYTGLNVKTNRTLQIDVKLKETVLTLDQDVIVVGDKPLVDVEETQSIKTISKEEKKRFVFFIHLTQLPHSQSMRGLIRM